MLAADKSRQVHACKHFMAQGHNYDLGRVLESKSLPSMIGSEKFAS
jgi:hypothetical protein